MTEPLKPTITTHEALPEDTIHDDQALMLGLMFAQLSEALHKRGGYAGANLNDEIDDRFLECWTDIGHRAWRAFITDDINKYPKPPARTIPKH